MRRDFLRCVFRHAIDTENHSTLFQLCARCVVHDAALALVRFQESAEGGLADVGIAHHFHSHAPEFIVREAIQDLRVRIWIHGCQGAYTLIGVSQKRLKRNGIDCIPGSNVATLLCMFLFSCLLDHHTFKEMKASSFAQAMADE